MTKSNKTELRERKDLLEWMEKHEKWQNISLEENTNRRDNWRDCWNEVTAGITSSRKDLHQFVERLLLNTMYINTHMRKTFVCVRQHKHTYRNVKKSLCVNVIHSLWIQINFYHTTHKTIPDFQNIMSNICFATITCRKNIIEERKRVQTIFSLTFKLSHLPLLLYLHINPLYKLSIRFNLARTLLCSLSLT